MEEEKIKVKIKKIDESLPLPKYETRGAVAFDLSSRIDIDIPAKTIAVIPAGIIIEIPSGYMLTVVTRSSATKRRGLFVPHGIGIIDQDYHGEKDELGVMVFNNNDEVVKVKKGERVGQAVFVKISKAEWIKTEKMSDKNRGGFGSTSNY